VKFPIGGKAREPFRAGSGEIPGPTVTVWMGEDSKALSSSTKAYLSLPES